MIVYLWLMFIWWFLVSCSLMALKSSGYPPTPDPDPNKLDVVMYSSMVMSAWSLALIFV